MGAVARDTRKVLEPFIKHLPRGTGIVVRGQVDTMQSSFFGLGIGLLGAILLVTLFIWFAENIGTFAHAWIYPHQQGKEWTPVGTGKIGSWYLLMLISYVLVAVAHGAARIDDIGDISLALGWLGANKRLA